MLCSYTILSLALALLSLTAAVPSREVTPSSPTLSAPTYADKSPVAAAIASGNFLSHILHLVAEARRQSQKGNVPEQHRH